VVWISKGLRRSSITTCRVNSHNTLIEWVVQPELDERDGESRFFTADPRSISLVGEADRKMLKAAIKQSDAAEVRHRIIPAEAVSAMGEKLAEMTDEVQEVLKEEREEKMVRV
jgi:hypothetical protein